MTKIIVALDYTNPLDALEMAAKLRGHVDGFKTNHTLWSQSVYIKDYTEGHELFIDCKLWDTPNTVKQVLQKIVDKGATMTTVSTLNSQSVFEEVSQFADKIKILGVTYLTSWNSDELKNITNQSGPLLWRENIDRIRPYGFTGLICSAKDLHTVNPLAPDFIKVCPGIGTNTGQIRTTTPEQAKELGADYIVIGRAVTESDDPVTTVTKIRESLSNTTINTL